ncbi:MAG: hypothetical protein CBB68_10485 [Rhodospirillaceae bacterium TMED8]|nr:uracil-DNA glycosylase [Magnetovibrio sp.]OUT49938.1 MAG: hypothetical protein CBB68_10485 [Rhodospirillaceae bacterium TMED8]
MRASIEWHQLVGVNEAIAPTPQNRLAVKQPPADPIPLQPSPSDHTHEVLASPKTLPRSSDQPKKSAIELAATANTLSALRRSLESFEGCTLMKTATNLVFADGQIGSKILFIGEAPGAEEDREGVPFVGPSGRLLDKMLASIELRRSDVMISNLVFWRPPGNRTPTQQEAAICMPFVERLIELVSPQILVPLGGPAAKSLLGQTQGIGRLRGKWYNFETSRTPYPIPSTPIFHPAYLLRTPMQKRTAWSDLRLIRNKLNSAQHT